MTKYKRIGIILILIGICIPLISFVFATGYNPHFGFWWSVTKMEIKLWHTSKSTLAPGWYDVDDARLVPHYVVLPYKYLFSLGIIFILVGICLFALSKSPQIERRQKE